MESRQSDVSRRLKLPEGIGTFKLPEQQQPPPATIIIIIIGGDKLFSGGGGDRTRTCNPTIDVLTLTFV